MQRTIGYEPPFAVTPQRKLAGRIVGVMRATGKGTWEFPSSDVDRLEVTHEGIQGERHFGWTRPSDVRVPYVKRGTPIRNTRHLSIVSVEDLAEIATRLGIATTDPRAIGANLVVEGIAHLSALPRGTKLLCEGDAILTVEDPNWPCRLAGKKLAEANPGRDDIELAFPKVARWLRGVVASVERPGVIAAGAAVEARLPEQWIYR